MMKINAVILEACTQPIMNKFEIENTIKNLEFARVMRAMRQAEEAEPKL